jgi:ActR/RegA family two-component response regulator
MVRGMELDAAVARACRDGAIALGDLHDLGATRSAIAHRVRDGRWRRPHREVYLVQSLVLDQDRALARAAILAGPSDAVLSHAAAVRAYGIQGVPRQDVVDLTLPRGVGHRAIGGVRIHRSDLPQVTVCKGLPVVSASHALRGVADQLSLPALLSAVDSALHLKVVTKEELLAVAPPRLLATRARWFRVLELADGRAESPPRIPSSARCHRGRPRPG